MRQFGELCIGACDYGILKSSWLGLESCSHERDPFGSEPENIASAKRCAIAKQACHSITDD